MFIVLRIELMEGKTLGSRIHMAPRIWENEDAV